MLLFIRNEQEIVSLLYYCRISRFGERLLVGPAKVNKVKIFLRPYYMMKRILTFVSDVQESVLLDFITQNKVKILH